MCPGLFWVCLWEGGTGRTCGLGLERLQTGAFGTFGFLLPPEPCSLSPGLPPAAASGQDPGARGGDQAHHAEGQEPAAAAVRAARVRVRPQHPGQRAEGARPALQQLQRAVPEHLCECQPARGSTLLHPSFSRPEPDALNSAGLPQTPPNCSASPHTAHHPARAGLQVTNACQSCGPVVARRVLCPRQGLRGGDLDQPWGY